jgi:hypothetical protein
MTKIATALFGVARDIVWLCQAVWHSWERR